MERIVPKKKKNKKNAIKLHRRKGSNRKIKNHSPGTGGFVFMGTRAITCLVWYGYLFMD